MGLLVGGELTVANYQAFMSRYYLNLWSKVPEFSSFLPQGKQEDFKTTVLEGMETAKHQVRVAQMLATQQQEPPSQGLMLASVFGCGIHILARSAGEI